MTDRCPLCPVSPEIECRGLKVRRFCDLIDPSHPSRVPGYEVSVQVASADAAIGEVEAMAARARSGETGGAGCGGCP